MLQRFTFEKRVSKGKVSPHEVPWAKFEEKEDKFYSLNEQMTWGQDAAFNY